MNYLQCQQTMISLRIEFDDVDDSNGAKSFHHNKMEDDNKLNVQSVEQTLTLK